MHGRADGGKRSDEQHLFLSDVLPTAYQGVEYADVKPGGTVAVLGLGPIGQMAARIAVQRGATSGGRKRKPKTRTGSTPPLTCACVAYPQHHLGDPF